MKKIICVLCSVLIAFSCQDYNDDNFEGYSDLENPKMISHESYTMLDADYTIIVNALNANKNPEDSILATKLKTAKKFTAELNPKVLIPYLLKSKYYALDVKSSAKISYLFDNARDGIVSGLTGAGYILTDADYKTVWGDPYATALTPAKSPEAKIPAILATRVSGAKAGDYKNVEYFYSNDEPITSVVENKILFEDFETYTAGSGVLVDIPNWVNKDAKGTIGWQCREYSSNKYAQVSAYKSGTENDVWLITKEANLAATSTPKFSFDVVVGNFNAVCLTVLISENFDGDPANIASATWTDVTSSFTLPQPATGYSTWASAGSLNLNAYKGKKVRIAFRYQGDDSNDVKKTTTYQIDNAKVSDDVIGLAVAKKAPQYASYKFDGSVWAKDNSVLMLQPADYEWLGLPFLTTAQAPTNLPNLLANKYPNGQEGDQKTVVYRTKSNEYYADNISKIQGAWTINSFIETITDQFVCAKKAEGKTWIFDPTFISSISKDDYNLIVAYVKEHKLSGNEDIMGSRGDSEFYYGFNAFYPNITYRVSDRVKDNTYPSTGTTQEQIDFMNNRTEEALAVLCTLIYPDAKPMVDGVEQQARISKVQIYKDPTEGASERTYWTYTFQCVGNKEWKFIERTK